MYLDESGDLSWTFAAKMTSLRRIPHGLYHSHCPNTVSQAKPASRRKRILVTPANQDH
jgi:hypothetical protein